MKQIKIHQSIDAFILDERYESELEQIFEDMLFSDEGMKTISNLTDEFLLNAQKLNYNSAESTNISVAELKDGRIFYILMRLDFRVMDDDYTQAFVAVTDIRELTVDEFLDEMLEIDKLKKEDEA
jgi:hypothetical protein